MDGTILIVDDDTGVRDSARMVLTREGYQVVTVPDGESAIKLTETADGVKDLSVVLCDLEMPRKGGREVIRHFRQQFPDIPILVMSGAADTAFLDGIVEAGVSDWLRKPLTRNELVQKVRVAINLCRLRRKQS